jgi:hypothetical protein
MVTPYFRRIASASSSEVVSCTRSDVIAALSQPFAIAACCSSWPSLPSTVGMPVLAERASL